jgi:CubicO group peptidase (beta-lactamase class C family)
MPRLFPFPFAGGVMTDIQGKCDERFKGVSDVLAANLDRGVDVGASVAVTVEGELVVDIWGGYADEDQRQPWERDTITNVWSTTKTMTALCALILADEGELDLNRAVSDYWPEFGAAGKRNVVLLRHLLGHTAGLPGWSAPMTIEDLYDWDKATSFLAAQEPWWEPGTVSGYHAVTQGYLVGEVIRRVTGETVGTFLREQVAGPLDADFHIGLDENDFARVSNVIPPPPMSEEAIAAASEVAIRVFGNPRLEAEPAWTEEWRRAEIPAANGHGNARSVAAIQAVMANGGEAGGKRFLSAAGVDRVLEEQADGLDLVLGMPIRFGMGYGLPSPTVPISPSQKACFWGGWGGSVVLVDMDQRMTFAYMMNKMGAGVVGDDRGFGLVTAMYQALES